jgi:hypothetical protein
LITSFGDEARSNLKAVKPLPFEVTVNRVVSRDYRLPALAVVGVEHLNLDLATLRGLYYLGA